MTHGKSEFRLKINRRDIAEIWDSSKQLRIEDVDFIRQAPYEDVMTAYVLLSLERFLKERRCEPDFEVVLSE